MKNIIGFILIGFPLLLFSQIIAKVEQYSITNEQLHSKIQEYDTSLSYLQAKEIALRELINNRALLIYAEKNGIQVTDQEVENFFIAQFGEHSSLQTAGYFDYDKFLELKNSSRGQKIWDALKQDLLLDKTETMIKSSLDIDDDALLERFVLDNVRIDIHYALMNSEWLNVDTQITPKQAFSYYRENKHKLQKDNLIDLDFKILFRNSLRDSALEIQKNAPSNSDSLFNSDSLSELPASTFTSILDSLWIAKANEIKKNWGINPKAVSAIDIGLSFQPTQLNPKVFHDDFKKKVQSLKWNEVGSYQTEDAIILFKKREMHESYELEPEPNDIWESYLAHIEKTRGMKDLESYYEQHFEDFIVPAAIVLKLELSDKRTPKPEVIEELLNSIYDDEKLAGMLNKYRVKKSNEIVFLERYENEPINQQIAERIKQGEHRGLVESDEKKILFRYSTLFPEYIPPFETLKHQLQQPAFSALRDTTGFYEYYQDNTSQFFTPDSLQLGGVFVPIVADTVDIPKADLKTYYETNQEFFIRDKSVQYDILFHTDDKLINQIYQTINTQNFEELKYLFHQPTELIHKKLVEYKELPESIQKTLMNSFSERVLAPQSYADGWIILWKQQEYPAGLVPLSQVEDNIRNTLQFDIANKAAYQFAKTVFDSTQYFSHCYNHAPRKMIFKTKFRNCDDTFEYIGELERKDEFMRLWDNEKYSSILEFENGYAVVFLLRRKSAQKMDYQTSIPKIADIFHEEKTLERAMNYANFLRSELQRGNDPDSLFFFFGGWKEGTDLSLQSSIPGIRYSDLILNNIIQHEKGYLSPIFNISEGQFFLYQIDEIRRVPRQMFFNNRTKYKNRIMQERYQNWLQKFKSTLSITIY